MRYLTSEQKESICHDISSNIFFRSIGHKYDISHTTVSRIYKRFCQGGHKSFLVNSGRKKKFEKNEILRMKRISNHNPFLSGREVRDQAVLLMKILNINTCVHCLAFFSLCRTFWEFREIMTCHQMVPVTGFENDILTSNYM